MRKFFNAFISYGRADSKEFAKKLQTSLNKHGFKVWFDSNDIPLGVDFQNQIDDGIEKADNFLFIISPHSINSEYCLKEIELAIKRNKRIIPLMHVEQINRETWLSRNLNGTDEEWELYKDEGKHDHFKNMHPTIRKINWVYFREDKDDFDKSLADLINLLRLHGDYVERHTSFLIKALEWERNQKQTRYLLTGEEKQKAQSWLTFRFKDEQPPCLPSNLHCEYITESIKNGNNLMTQVMLSYAEEDRATMEKIRASLRREGITVWTNTTDIKTGEEFWNSIQEGIEKADNLVYLLSPNAVKSINAQRELDIAVSLNKRIIPLLVQKTDNLELPFSLQGLQYIDFTDNLEEAHYQLDESQLLKILYEDAAYYNEHKILLTKALKWKRQNNNPSILLRGYNLRSAETWLEVAQKRTQHPPTPLQSEFITASLQQPPLESLDVFVSYSRADSDLARKLNDTLQLQGKTTWFDQESIASGSDFQEEIYGGIKASDNFLFILSPRSVNSPYCNSEVEYAASLNKRFVTVLHREVNTSDLHPELAKVQWIDFNSNQKDFNANFNQLLRTLETDREHIRSHTKWSQRALEWEDKDKSNDLLLRGNEFVIAQNWLEETEQQNKKPSATVFQKDFIQASENAIEALEKQEKHRQESMLLLQEEKIKEAEARLAEKKKSSRRQKAFLVATSMACVIAVGFGLKSQLAEEEAEKAQKDQLNSVSRISLILSQQNLKFDALFEAIKAGKLIQGLIKKEGLAKNLKTQSLILRALQDAVYEDGFREQNRLIGHEGTVFDVAWSPDGKKIATAGGDGKIKLWNLNGKKINCTKVGNYSEVYSVSFNRDAKTIAFTSSEINGLWNISKKTIQQTKLTGDKKKLTTVNSPGGKIIATASGDNTVKISNKQGGFLQTLKGHNGSIMSIKFSPDGKTIATASEDNTVKLWSLSDKKLKKLQGDNKAEFWSVAWSPDGKTIASGRADNTVKLWTKKDGEWKFIPTQIKHDGAVSSVSFSPDGKTIASASKDNTIKLWNNQGKFLRDIGKHNKPVWSLAWSPDGNTIASASGDNTIKLWNKDGKKLQTFPHKGTVWSVAWSPDGNTIASASSDNTVKLWNKNGKEIQTLKGHTASVASVAWSPDGNMIASASNDNTIKLWNIKGEVLETLKGHNNDILSVAFSPNGKKIASTSKDLSVKLWNLDGEELQTLYGHNNRVTSVSFSPDGKTLASASDDETVIVWNLEDLTLDKLMEDACQQVKDYLSTKDDDDDEEKKLCKYD
ncbi:TIR domain-containing protein [Calothrix sp. CCY 0018]|uniref:TIR domain-containing protein n=1 Tax=Calothrix sp. CCY 0018 TaxID=3103864 RepID=UPI0039C7258A